MNSALQRQLTHSIWWRLPLYLCGENYQWHARPRQRIYSIIPEGL